MNIIKNVFRAYRGNINNAVMGSSVGISNKKIAAKSEKYFRKASKYNSKAARIIDRYECFIRQVNMQIAQSEASQVHNSSSEINEKN